jgi:hypothetical protein
MIPLSFQITKEQACEFPSLREKQLDVTLSIGTKVA